MLRKRIIPIVLLDGFSVLKTIEFSERRNLGSPITVVRTYNTRNVDELILLDIDASSNGEPIDRFLLRDITKECFMPLSVGGGIKTIKDIEGLLKVGADKVVINTQAIITPNFITEASSVFGSQCIVVSIDVVMRNNEYLVYNKCESSGIDVFTWAKKVEALGAGEVLINCVDLDGKMTGGDLELADKVSEMLSIPVIYAGGISSPEDAACIAETKVSAIAAASIFHFTDDTPEDCRKALSSRSIPVR